MKNVSGYVPTTLNLVLGAASYQQALAAGEDFDYDNTSCINELGVKTDWLDSRARLNVAVFRTEFDDLQVGAFDSSANGFVVKNAAQAVSQGVEISGTYKFGK